MQLNSLASKQMMPASISKHSRKASKYKPAGNTQEHDMKDFTDIATDIILF
jgi:hypothetical protein